MKIFDDIFSIIHLLLGVITALVRYPLNVLPIIIFIIYEIATSETKKEILNDCIEFFIGLIIGLVVLYGVVYI